MSIVASRTAARLLLVALLSPLAGEVAASEAPVDSFAARSQVAALDPKVADRIAPFRPAAHEPFGLAAEPAEGNVFAARWRRVESEIRSELQSVALCRAEPERCSPAALRFIAIVDAGRKREGRARIGEINRAVNLAIRPMSDTAQHGALDVWGAPLQTFASGAGDCEDYAIAKFAALRESGFAEADLRLMVVQEAGSDSKHAVVSVRLDGGWLMLDSRRLAVLDEKSFQARPLLALQAHGLGTGRPDEPAAVTAAANQGLQNFGGWTAPPLLMRSENAL